MLVKCYNYTVAMHTDAVCAVTNVLILIII